MSNIQNNTEPDEAGSLHSFEYEGENLIHFNAWVLANKTKEEHDFWNANDAIGKHTDVGAEYYPEWLISQKLIHTITKSDGTVVINDYHEFL
jgi:hypothetical protein